MSVDDQGNTTRNSTLLGQSTMIVHAIPYLLYPYIVGGEKKPGVNQPIREEIVFRDHDTLQVCVWVSVVPEIQG